MQSSKPGPEPSAADGPSSDDQFAVGGDADDLIRRSVRGSFATVLSQGTRMVIQLGSQVILARLLFPAEFGLLAMAYPIIALLQVFNDIGLGQAVIQRPTLASQQVSTLFWVNIGISCVLALVVALLAPLAAWMYGEPQLTLLTIVLGLMLPVVALGILPGALLARQMRFGVLARNEVIALVVSTSTTILFAVLGFSYWSLVIGQFASALTTNILVWTACRWRLGRPKFTASVWHDVKFGGNITLSNLATFVTTSGDNMIVGLTTGKVPLGFYDRSYNLVVRPLNQMMAPLSRVAVPLLSRLAGRGEEYRASYLQMFRTAVLLTVPAMLVCVTHGTALIALLLGPRWSAAAPVFSWLCVGGLASGVYQTAFWMLISQDRAAELRIYAALAAIINVISYLIGAFWGVVGIAIGASTGFVLVTTPLLLFGATRRGPVTRGDVMRCSLPFIVSALIVYAALKFGMASLALPVFPMLVVATLVSYGLFTGLALAGRENRRLLKAGIHSALEILSGLKPAWSRSIS